MLNGKGSTPAAVLGIDYKSTIKPALTSFADDIKKSSMAKLEELISLQQQSVETAAKIEQKKNRITALQSRIDEVSAVQMGFHIIIYMIDKMNEAFLHSSQYLCFYIL